MIFCNNGFCAIASWCKRYTYAMKMEEGTYASSPFLDCPNNNYRYYVKNKHREIYERQNPDDIFNFGKREQEYLPSDAESEQRQHDDNNREPGVRENNSSGGDTEAPTPRYESTSISDSLFQLLNGCRTGSDSEDFSLSLSEETRRAVERTRQIYDEVARAKQFYVEINRELDANLQRRLSDPEFRIAVFQDSACDGLSSVKLIPRPINETVSMPGIRGACISTDDRGDEHSLWDNVSVEEDLPW